MERFDQFVVRVIEDNLCFRGVDLRNLPQEVQDALRNATDEIVREHENRQQFTGSYNALMQDGRAPGARE